MNLKKNIGEKERTVRILVGLSMLVATAAGYITGGGAIVAAIASVILLATGLLNHCPLYSALGCSNFAACSTQKGAEDTKPTETKE